MLEHRLFPFNPPAIVQEAVDLEKSIARLKELKEQRQRNTRETARIFAEIRRAYPDVPGKQGQASYSPQFVRAIEESGYSRASAATYLWLHNNPDAKQHRGGAGGARRAAYKRVLTLIEKGATLDQLRSALTEELKNESA